MYLVRYFPSGNREDLPLIAEQLANLDISHQFYVLYDEVQLQQKGWALKIPAAEEPKLPSDTEGHYLPRTEDSGFSYEKTVDPQESDNCKWFPIQPRRRED